VVLYGKGGGFKMTSNEAIKVTLVISEELRRKLEDVSRVEGKSVDAKVNDLLLSYFECEGDEK